MTKRDILENQVKSIYLAIGSNLGNRKRNIEKAKFINDPSLEDYIESDKNARLIAKTQIK